MKQKTISGDETVVNRGELIRQVYEEIGGAGTIEQIARACLKAKVFDTEFADRALLKAAQTACRRALKTKDKSGLPFAGPVRESDGKPTWIQRQLWDHDDYNKYIGQISEQRDSLTYEISLLRAERRERFGK